MDKKGWRLKKIEKQKFRFNWIVPTFSDDDFQELFEIDFVVVGEISDHLVDLRFAEIWKFNKTVERGS